MKFQFLLFIAILLANASYLEASDEGIRGDETNTFEGISSLASEVILGNSWIRVINL